MRDDPESVCDEDTKAHAGHIEDPLRHHEAHREEEVGRRDEGQDHQRQGLHERNQTSCLVSMPC